MKVRDLVKKLLELDQDREIELSPELIDALDINPSVNNRKFPTQNNKIIFTYRSNYLLPLSFNCYFYNTRIDREYQFRLLRSMTIFNSRKLNWKRFRTSIGHWRLKLSDSKIINRAINRYN